MNRAWNGEKRDLLAFLRSKAEKAYENGDYNDSILYYDALIEEYMERYLRDRYDIALSGTTGMTMDELKKAKVDAAIINMVEKLWVLRSQSTEVPRYSV
jgi:hypothetical protein